MRTLLLGTLLALPAFLHASLDRPISLACAGSFSEAAFAFAEIIVSNAGSPESAEESAEALHSLGNLAALEGKFVLAAYYHAEGRRTFLRALPPLAIMYQNEEPCNNIGDIYWVSSFAKKTMFEVLEDVVDLTEMPADGSISAALFSELDMGGKAEVFNAHTSLGTQLEDSGMVEWSMLHFGKAEEIVGQVDEGDVSLTVRNSIMVPVMYDNEVDLVRGRKALEEKVDRLYGESERVALRSLNQLSMPGTFYIIYQGGNDKELMTKIRGAYVRHPNPPAPARARVWGPRPEGFMGPGPPPDSPCACPLPPQTRTLFLRASASASLGA
jgi:hypothetical protein